MSLPSTLGCLSAGEMRCLIKTALPEPPPEDEPKSPDEDGKNELSKAGPIAKTLGTLVAPPLAFGAGAVAGYGGSELLGRALKKRNAMPAPRVLKYGLPIVGGMATMGYNMYQQRQIDELKRALEGFRDKSARSVSAS